MSIATSVVSFAVAVALLILGTSFAVIDYFSKERANGYRAILALKLQNTPNKTVDFALPFSVSHSGDYDLEELFDWAKTISTK